MGAPTLYTVIAVFLWIASSPQAIAHDKRSFNEGHYRHQHSPHCHAQQRREQARWQKWHRQQHAQYAYHRHHDNGHGQRQNIVIYRGPQGLTPKYRSTIRTGIHTAIDHRGRRLPPHRAQAPDTQLRIELGRMGVHLRF